MNFLAPLFLLGALAVILPVIFHLIRRTSRDRMIFSSLMFLAPSPPRVTRRSRLEDILLMLLRCLVVGLLALAFARPYFHKPGETLPQPEGLRRMAVLIDTSASMRRSGLWDEALNQARQVLRQAGAMDEAALFAFDRNARTLLSFEEWSALGAGERAAIAIERLQSTQPSWSGTHFANALIAAVEALAEAAKKDEVAGIREIVLISDLQEGGRLERLQGFEWPDHTVLTIVPIAAQRPSNAGLSWVADSEDMALSITEAGPRIRVSNSSDSSREQYQIRWEGANAESVEVYVPPGQSRVVNLAKPAGGTAKLVLQGDDHDFDNTAYYVDLKAERIAVAYLGNEAPNDPAQPLYYLRRAFQQTKRHDVEIVSYPATASLSAADLTAAALVIVSEPVSGPRLELLRDYVRGGKAALFVIKDAAAVQMIPQLLGSDPMAAREISTSRYAMFGEIQFDHPLFAPFADPRFSDFTKIHFWKYRQIDPGQISGAQVLARFDSGDPALLEIPLGKGELLVFTSSWQPSDSQLALSSKFIPLLYSMLEQNGALRANRVQYHVGDSIELSFPDDIETLTVAKPDGSNAAVKRTESFIGADLPGLHRVSSTNAPFEFAVNLDSLESQTGPMPIEEFERFGVRLKKEKPEVLVRRAEMQRQQWLATELESQQKLWRKIVIAAFVLLIFETLLAGWQSRRSLAKSAA